jgi:hypothetical protein
MLPNEHQERKLHQLQGELLKRGNQKALMKLGIK